jgi:microcompartment protein CcmK/EutM
MQLARVVGTIVATRKDENLTGIKLLLTMRTVSPTPASTVSTATR